MNERMESKIKRQRVREKERERERERERWEEEREQDGKRRNETYLEETGTRTNISLRELIRAMTDCGTTGTGHPVVVSLVRSYMHMLLICG